MRWRGLEPPRPARGTRPSTLRVYQFRHQRARSALYPRPRLTPSESRATVMRTDVRPGSRDMLSKRQQEIYDFVVRYAAKHGYPPTVREIGEEVGLADRKSTRLNSSHTVISYA